MLFSFQEKLGGNTTSQTPRTHTVRNTNSDSQINSVFYVQSPNAKQNKKSHSSSSFNISKNIDDPFSKNDFVS